MTVDSSSNFSFGTRAVHVGAPIDATTGAVIEPISLSTTFGQSEPSKPLGIYEYSRSANPNRDNFEQAVASLEQAKYAIALSSGSATTALIIQSLPIGSHIISGGDVYGGTHRYFTKVANHHGVEAQFVANLADDLEATLRPETKLVWVETPSNPTLQVTDIAKVKQILQNHQDKTGNKVILVVDNTFLSPYISNPLKFGADVVVHSVTKYINGHSDVVMGVLATNDSELHEKFRFLQNAIGSIPSPFDSWLAHRGLKTLHLRLRQASNSAQKIAEFLQSKIDNHNDGSIIHVNYPGLSTHKNHDVVSRQHRDGLGGGMISFRIRGGAKAASIFTSSTQLFTLAESLGGIESLIEVPAIMTHGGIPKEEREANGVYDDLVRVSVGIEDTDDLIADIQQALKKVASSL
ncbi:cystathionine gamma-lyase cys3 [Lodderomyces elongisporus]|uniref:cystathionine gamma-lyase n=1 Tax=Lodderomyces elongisporus (strain ATCC 11503 / CBS 2605 / JCM 1781 / NBRC 1676 / NRRL YB-4239) TaxID=379508 RepID=A5E0C2_LODEL|nr:cystathionine gamma-lyase cys3 [Lodderomyces elongisporus]EDK44880.1 cystathionine gamma-lyase [Lodderomyces elongisporus NRRL YB-4239]WLF78807.1 cystathionine gamma-lyase cys3 [Lodderomyces elongisporus]